MYHVAAVRLFTITIALATLVVAPALSQQFHPKQPPGSGYPVENKPKVDEKAYKAALDRIPTPDKAYDPWGGAHAAEAPRSGKKPN
ncbi:hypothetical protein AOQ73_19260 [Bradyrhizobium pachyrhizi]|uniref:hypothetical protein n=1 Tax=Bradyrhizobium pachyrhizi TaxID=280333 RepID=UPI00070500DB|nr:hypothetical protein [Bradyrhizobium pachyrhizi]KRQ00345.1 hypothetical protein AOQ73_19260 [Bradyrhizobium pachyrhizi]